MAKLSSRAWRKWAEGELVPRLDRPHSWTATGAEWKVYGNAILGLPSGWIAQGLMRWTARSGDWFEGRIVIVPLYVPTEDLHISRSLRLNSETMGSGFDNPTVDSVDRVTNELVAAVNRDGVGYLEEFGVLSGYAALIRDDQASTLAERGVFTLGEELGYTEVLLGNYESAEEQLALQSQPVDGDVEWKTRMRSRCAHVLELLQRDPGQAREQLRTWACASAAALKIDIDPSISRPGSTA